MRILILLLAMVLGTAVKAAADIKDSGDTPFKNIVIAPNAPDSVKLAATELQKYIKKACGTGLPIFLDNADIGEPPHIFIGKCRQVTETTTSLLSCDEFRIISKPGSLSISGNDYAGKPIYGLRNPWRIEEVWNKELKIGAFGSCGTLNGVYYFLDKYLGIRWYMPGETGEVVPAMPSLRLPSFDISVKPDFSYRYIWFADFSEAPDDALWFRRVGLGGKGPAQFIHSFDFFLKYKDSHPEYFALVDGERDFAFKCACGGGGHLCLSNPEVAKQFAKNICAYFKNHPEQITYPVMPNDGLNRICECKGCSADLSSDLPQESRFSNHIWKFVNNVAKEVGKEYPDKIIGCCPYGTYSEPPSNIDKLEPNVAIMITRGRLCFTDKNYEKEVRDRISRWQKKTDSIYMWEYYIHSWLPWRNIPVFPAKQISEDLKYLKSIGCKGEFIEAESWIDDPSLPHRMLYPGMQHLNIYLTSKLYWNADQDIKPLLQEYYELFYGPASNAMKDFWELVQKCYQEKGAVHLHAKGSAAGPPNVSPSLIYTSENLDMLSSYLEQAVNSTPADSVYRKRIEIIRNEFDAGKRMLVKLVRKEQPEMHSIKLDENTANAFDAIKKTEPQQFVNKVGEDTPYKTWVYSGWDKDKLYLSFICFEPKPEKLKMAAVKHDQDYIWLDDSVEIYIAPDEADRRNCFQIIVTPKGTSWDAKRKAGESGAGLAGNWDGKFTISTDIQKNRWIVDVAIPMKDIGINPEAGKRIAVNFYRTRVADGSGIYSNWAPIFTFGFFSPDKFGTLILDGNSRSLEQKTP